MNPPLPSDFVTGFSKCAMRLRVMPKTLKNESQNVLASASSEVSSSNSLENVMARARISFQLSGICHSSHHLQSRALPRGLWIREASQIALYTRASGGGSH